MRLRATVLLSLLLVVGCRLARQRPDPATLDAVARRYVVLALELGRHDPNYVDAYYGPDSLQVAAQAESLGLGAIRTRAESLITVLGDSVPAYSDSLVRMRHRYLRTQLGSMVARARLVGGEHFSFDDEAKAIYDVDPPHFSEAHFDSLLTRLDSLLPGSGPLADRVERFRRRVLIPKALVDTVFKTAIAACRTRTLARMSLPEGERFDLEYVTGKSWGAYNWYKGGYHSLIQVNVDLPIAVDRAIDLACHEGYPGHHVYNASLERALVRGRGWVELSVYPLFSPQSLIAEGSANFGIQMAFPGAVRTAFERDSLFPLAGLDPRLAERNAGIREALDGLDYARNEAARRYLDGELSGAAATAMMQRYLLMSRKTAEKSVQFVDIYRSYVINYNLGQDLVGAWVARHGGDDPAGRWRAFEGLLASPRLPGDLQ